MREVAVDPIATPASPLASFPLGRLSRLIAVRDERPTCRAADAFRVGPALLDLQRDENESTRW